MDNKPAPLVSVVIPSYNHQDYIAEAVHSVLRQSLAELELIVIDDGSSDASADIVAAIDDPRLSLVRQPNAGAHAAINRGLAMARGEYVAILNSDDRYQPGRLAELVELARRRKPAETFAVTGVRLIDAEGQPIEDRGHPWHKMYADILARWHADPDPARALLWGNFGVSTSNFFCDRSLIERLGPMRRLRYVHDWEYALRVALQRPESFVFRPADTSLDYRMHGANTILGGQIRNHLEAAHVLRRALVRHFGPQLAQPLRRIRYLDRFVRQRESWVREHRFNLAAVEHQRTLAEKDHRIEAAQALIEAKNGLIAEQGHEIAQRTHELAQRTHECDRLHAELAARQAHIDALLASRSWRLTAPLRRAGHAARIARASWRALRQQLRHAGPPQAQLRRLVLLARREGPRGVLARLRGLASAALHTPAELPAEPRSAHCSMAYAQWLAAEREHLAGVRARLPDTLAALAARPRFSIIVPVFNTAPAMLERMLASVAAQFYPDWELCLCDDASTEPALTALLDTLPARDPRIRLHRRISNGHIAAASNDALAIASGDFVVLLDHDDELAPHALLRLAEEIGAHPEADLLYSDEDKIGEDGLRCLPFFKPDWSPTLAATQNYIGHLLCARRSLPAIAEGFRGDMNGAQDYDFVLRLAETARSIRHIAEVLYHWRLHPGSTAQNAGSKPYAHEAGRRALAEHLARRYPQHFLRVEDSPHLFVYEPRFRVPPAARASIIIPTRDKVELLDACIDSIVERTEGAEFEILVLDNGSSEPASLDYFERIQRQDPRVKVLPATMPFNWSRLNNLGARSACGTVLVFLNNDTEVIRGDWLARLMEHALLPDVGTVGARLLYDDGTLQHAGVVVGMGGWADHVFKACRDEHLPSPFVSSAVSRNVLASTGACVAIARSTFDALGGFDEAFEICGSDVEIGIRAHHRGLQNVYLAPACLYHHESKTRGSFVPENDFIQSELKYAPYRLDGDPFYNPNLSLSTPVPTPRFPGAAA